MDFFECANDIILIAFRERRWNRDQNAALKELIGRWTSSLGVLHAQAGILCEVPRKPAAIHARHFHQAGDVVVKMKSPLGHNDV